jgi:pimeloyl-ACP methyl ester carboxylesterase
MSKCRLLWLLLIAAVLVGTPGCSTFVAHRIAQAPNTYPTWFAPKARVELGFSSGFLTNFPAKMVTVGPPAAKLRYRVVEPADYNLKVWSTNWIERGEEQFDFSFGADLRAKSNAWTGAPRGTVVLLHGYGVAQFAMAPWAMRLAQEGWRCVLVDLRGHGKSTGRRIYFGVQEVRDLGQLLDELTRDGELHGPVMAMGESYGAALALRWEATDPRVRAVVAIAPYAELATAVINIGRDYASWVPSSLLRAGMRKLPAVLDLPADELDTTTVLTRSPVAALFVAGTADKVTPLADVQRLESLAASGSKLVVVPKATHEAVTYFFDQLAAPVTDWLAQEKVVASAPASPKIMSVGQR